MTWDELVKQVNTELQACGRDGSIEVSHVDIDFRSSHQILPRWPNIDVNFINDRLVAMNTYAIVL